MSIDEEAITAKWDTKNYKRTSGVESQGKYLSEWKNCQNVESLPKAGDCSLIISTPACSWSPQTLGNNVCLAESKCNMT